MKNLVLIGVLMASIMVSSAQERQDAASLTFTTKSAQLSSATGWYLTTDGKWIDNKNKLSPSQIDNINGMETNFTWLQMGTIMTGGKKYYILFNEYVDGEYDYPLTQVDWKKYSKVQAMIMDQEEYDKLKSALTKKEAKDIMITPKIFVLSYKLDGAYTDAELLKQIKTTLNEATTNGISRLIINAQTIKGAEIVRFMIPCNFFVSDLSGQYYEVPLADFKKLLID